MVSANAAAKQFRFIGNNGEIMKVVDDTKSAIYIIRESDPYIRTEVAFNNNSVMYLNPVIRYSGEFPVTNKTTEVDVPATLRERIIYFVFALIIAFLLSKWRMRKKSR